MKKAIALILFTISVVAYDVLVIDEFSEFEELDRTGQPIACNELVNFEEDLSYINSRTRDFVNYYAYSRYEFKQCEIEIKQKFNEACERRAGKELTASDIVDSKRLYNLCGEYVEENIVESLSFSVIKLPDGIDVVKVNSENQSYVLNPVMISSVKIYSELISDLELFTVEVSTQRDKHDKLRFNSMNEDLVLELQELLAKSISSINKKQQ